MQAIRREPPRANSSKTIITSARPDAPSPREGFDTQLLPSPQSDKKSCTEIDPSACDENRRSLRRLFQCQHRISHRKQEFIPQSLSPLITLIARLAQIGRSGALSLSQTTFLFRSNWPAKTRQRDCRVHCFLLNERLASTRLRPTMIVAPMASSMPSMEGSGTAEKLVILKCTSIESFTSSRRFERSLSVARGN